MPLLRFESLFVNKEIQEEFYKFLKEDKSEESWEFLRISMRYTKKEAKVSSNQLKKLSDKYLHEKGPKSINISSEARKKVLQELDQGKVQALKPVQATILSEMKYDSFKRFCRSKQGEKIIKKYEKDNTVILPDLTSEFTYNDAEFTKPKINETDVKFMKYLLEDSTNWELLTSFREGEYGSRIGNIWFSTVSFLPDVSFSKDIVVSKYEIKLPFKYEHVICSTFPSTQQLRNDSYITFSKTQHVDKAEKTVINLDSVTLPFPYTPRVVPSVYTIHLNHSSCMLIGKPCDLEMFKDHAWGENKECMCQMRKDGKEKKTKAFKMFDFQCIQIQKLGNAYTSFTQCHLFSLGGWIKNKSSLQSLIKERGQKLIFGLKENLTRKSTIETISDLKTKKFFELDGISQILAEFEEEIVENDDSSVTIKDNFMDSEFCDSESLVFD